jgi:hypothetical protein
VGRDVIHSPHIHEADTAALAAMRARFGSAALDDAHRLSYRLFEDRPCAS